MIEAELNLPDELHRKNLSTRNNTDCPKKNQITGLDKGP